jgi:hypothetical protein|tara:strand:+ start:3545 stop:4315 length:771 start_codon:yes stop_codon:yes gene_type:complete
MALERRNYDPAIMAGASDNYTIDLLDVLDVNENELLEFDSVASAVNHMRLANAATGNPVVLSCEGEDDVGFEFHNSEGEEILILDSAATSVNEYTITSAATGANPTIAATGGDANIDVELQGKGTGGVLMKTGSEIVTATNVLTAAESGKVCFLNSATEFVSTLPAVAQGLRFRFIVTAAPSGASYTVVTDSSANVIEGSVVVDGAAIPGANEDTITFADGAAAVGDWVEVISDGTSWLVSGIGEAAGSITLTQAS